MIKPRSSSLFHLAASNGQKQLLDVSVSVTRSVARPVGQPQTFPPAILLPSSSSSLPGRFASFAPSASNPSNEVV